MEHYRAVDDARRASEKEQRQREEKQREERCAQERLEAERVAADKVEKVAAEEQRRQAQAGQAAEARRQAQAEGLLLRAGKSKTGYLGVHLYNSVPGAPNPYQACVRRGGKQVYLGTFATAEEAALRVARSPEGQVAAQKAAAATPPLTSEEEVKGSFVKEGAAVPPMPPDAYVKVEIVVKEEEGSLW